MIRRGPNSSGADRAAVPAALAVAGAIILGGGGSPDPQLEVLLQLLVAALSGYSLLLMPDLLRRSAFPALVIGGLLVLLPLLQLIPLPPALWQSMPGRELQRSALAVVGAENSWRPMSVSPARTLAALLAMVSPALVVVLVAAQDRAGRALVIGMIAATGLFSLILGVGQLIYPDPSPFWIFPRDVGPLQGFNGNHNHAATVLLIAMVAQAACVADRQDALHGRGRSTAAVLVLAIAVILSIAVFLTASRAGAFMLPVAWAWVGAIALGLTKLPARRLGMAALTGLVVIATVAGLIGMSERGRQVLARYDFAGELRPEIWTDSLAAAKAYFPWGAGMGTFGPVFMSFERLDRVGPTIANRVHNDYLELLLEAGLPGLLVFSIITIILMIYAKFSLSDRSAVPTAHSYFALGTLSIITIHSLVDNPLREMSLACVAAAAAAILLPSPRRATRMPQGTMEEQV